MKGVAPIVAILIGLIGVSAVGLPIAASYSKPLPGTALYGMRTAGDAIRCAFSSDRRACFENFAQEREQQAKELQNTQPDVAKQLQDDAQQIRQRESGSRNAASSQPIPRATPR